MESVHARPEDVPLQDTFETKEKLLKYIRDGVIGKDVQIRTPYGMKPLHYCDYTASGRSLSFIEDYIRDQILPIYANTHTLNSRTAKQTIYSREEARDIIKRCVNGNERDAVIFNGTGSTGAVNHLVKSLDIRYKKDGIEHHTEGCADNFWQVNRWKTLDCTLWNMSFSNQGFYEDHEKSGIHQKSYAKYKETHQIKFTEPPVVFVSVMEHNSNYLPWYEKDKDIIIEFVNLDLETGEINYKELEDIISKYQSYNGLKIGTFSAGSNITGILNDVDYISYLMHKAGGLCFIDYAAAAPYVDINVNGKTDRFSRVSQEEAHFWYKDAIFISPHKFVGGPDTPGILVCKKKLLCNNKPIQVGGGIVFFVDKESHMYIRGVEEREEAGTPSIIGVIRAGLSFQLKEQLTPEFIEHKEHEIVQYVNQRFSQMKNIVLLGNNELDKVPIYSFMVRHQGKFLHFHFVGKLLNDLFGIQTRTGCSCAAVYGQQLLGIDLPLARKYKDALCHGHEMLRMGYVRLNFGYFMSQEDIDYILDAIEFVGKYGWMFLPDYTFDKEFAEFYVHADTDHKERNWIGEIGKILALIL